MSRLLSIPLDTVPLLQYVQDMITQVDSKKIHLKGLSPHDSNTILILEGVFVIHNCNMRQYRVPMCVGFKKLFQKRSGQCIPGSSIQSLKAIKCFPSTIHQRARSPSYCKTIKHHSTVIET